MRREGMPLFTLESWRPVREADLLGITLQAELTYSNVLEVLDLAGIPLRAADRGEDDPIVMAGGPSASNPEPLAPFFDAFFMGEAEEAFELVLDAIDAGGRPRGAAARGWPRCPTSTCPRRGRRPVERAIYAEFGIETQPTRAGRAVRHRRSSPAPRVEVMRGCTRGCRFCHAGTWYRPVRERPADEVVEAGLEQLGCTGYDELSLTSLATSDYTDVDRRDRGRSRRRGRTCTCRCRPTGSTRARWRMTAAANARQRRSRSRPRRPRSGCATSSARRSPTR